jgi:opacity protein-like surface antigen
MDRTTFRNGAVLSIAAAALATAPAAAQRDADFLFGTPKASLGFRIGYAVPAAGSEVFDFNRQELTLEKRDFNAPFIGGELGIRLTDRLDLAVGLGFEESDARSEFRDWVDQNDLPIEQNTKFRRVPLTLSMKVFLSDRGRSIGRFAWIPETWTPFLGYGGGVVWYRFEQVGDFVDFDSLDIVNTRYTAKGSSLTGHLLGGLDVTLTPRWVITTEARYSWANGDMGYEYSNFNDLDLDGFRLSVGLSARF